jgi:hypothetical protein
MDDIVHQEGVRSSLFRMLGNGVPAIGEQLTSRLEMRREGKTLDDAIDAGRIYAHFRAGKTLTPTPNCWPSTTPRRSMR